MEPDEEKVSQEKAETDEKTKDVGTLDDLLGILFCRIRHCKDSDVASISKEIRDVILFKETHNK